MTESGAGAVVARMWCRVVGHKWALMPGISHGHDELYECRRCGRYDWRDLPAAVEVQAHVDTHVEDESTRVRTSGRPAAAPVPGRRR